jgi:hypothetical protein
MPSSPNYVRDLKQEYATQKARGEVGVGSNSGNALRHKARRKALKLGMVKPGQDLDHKKPISKGGGNTPSNWQAKSPSANRSFARNPDGSMKSQTSKKGK